MSTLHRTQIYLENSQIAELDARAKALGVTRSDLIRDLIDKGLVANDSRPRLYDVLIEAGPMPDADAVAASYETRRADRRARLNARRQPPQE